jgi:hypothetical protein
MASLVPYDYCSPECRQNFASPSPSIPATPLPSGVPPSIVPSAAPSFDPNATFSYNSSSPSFNASALSASPSFNASGLSATPSGFPNVTFSFSANSTFSIPPLPSLRRRAQALPTIPAEAADLKVGAELVTTATKNEDGTFSTARVTVGKNGVAPPL